MRKGMAISTLHKPSQEARRKALRKNVLGWSLMAPALVFMLLFTVYPVIRSFYLGMTDYSLGMEAPVFIGFHNYVKLAGTALFWKVVRNTLYFALLTVFPSMALGLGLALLVNRSTKTVSFLRVGYFYPVVMPMIAAASIWSFIYMSNNGLWDQFLRSIGRQPMDVLSSKTTVLPAMAIMYVWKEAGYLMVFFLSGIQSISPELMEAAKLDGASHGQVFRRIMLPLLGPTTLFVTSIEFTNCFKLVDHVMIMTEGAPNNYSTLLLYYIYQQGFTNFNYGISNALTVIMLLFLLAVSLPRFFSQDRKIYYS